MLPQTPVYAWCSQPLGGHWEEESPASILCGWSLSGVGAKSPSSSLYLESLTFYFFSVSEEAIEDVEGPSEAAADPEELAKDQESGGEKDQGKWTGSVCSRPRLLMLLPWSEVTARSQRADASSAYSEKLHTGSVPGAEGFCFCFLEWSPSFFSYYSQLFLKFFSSNGPKAMLLIEHPGIWPCASGSLRSHWFSSPSLLSS